MEEVRGLQGVEVPPAARFARGDRLRTLYFIAAAVLAALVPLILFAGLWVRSELDKGQREEWTLPPKRQKENARLLPVLQ